jgi:hypothetical protein
VISVPPNQTIDLSSINYALGKFNGGKGNSPVAPHWDLATNSASFRGEQAPIQQSPLHRERN